MEYANLRFIRSRQNAVVPKRAHETDTGYDLTIVDKVQEFNSKTTLYTTGIKIQLENGFYAEIVPRSSLSKSGYILANSVGIIDETYQGELMIAVTKIVDEVPDLQLPFRGFQLIIRRRVNAHFTEVEFFEEKTERSEGGFGSSGGP